VQEILQCFITNTAYRYFNVDAAGKWWKDTVYGYLVTLYSSTPTDEEIESKTRSTEKNLSSKWFIIM
jgi:hypothetical protein